MSWVVCQVLMYRVSGFAAHASACSFSSACRAATAGADRSRLS